MLFMPHAACMPIPNLWSITRGGGIMVGNRRGGSHAILKGCYVTQNYAAREGGVASVVIGLRAVCLIKVVGFSENHY